MTVRGLYCCCCIYALMKEGKIEMEMGRWYLGVGRSPPIPPDIFIKTFSFKSSCTTIPIPLDFQTFLRPLLLNIKGVNIEYMAFSVDFFMLLRKTFATIIARIWLFSRFYNFEPHKSLHICSLSLFEATFLYWEKINLL